MKKYKNNYSVLVTLLAILLLSSCYERKRFPEPQVQERSLLALINDLRTAPATRPSDPLFAHYSTFKAALAKTGLDELLRDNSKRFIVFAPDDLAFEQLPLQFKTADLINDFISGTIDANGDPVQPQYNDSILLRKIVLNHIVEVVNNSEFDLGSQRTLSSLATHTTDFLPANNPFNTPWVNNTLTTKPSQGVFGSLTFVPPSVNGVPMFSWDTKASNGVLNTIGAILFPANVYEFIKKDSRHSGFATMVDYYPDLVATLSDPNIEITAFPSRTAALTNTPQTRVRVQHHFFTPASGRVANLAPTGTIRYVANLNAGRSTGIRLAATTTCLGTANAAALFNDPQSAVIGGVVVGYPGLGAYFSASCLPPNGLFGYIATSNGLVFSTSALLNE